MPNPVIPNGFKPLIRAYSIGAPGGVKATEVAGGSPRVALDYDRGPQQFQVSMVLTPDAFSVWTAWFFHLIKKGAYPFDMELDSGFGCQVHSCKMVPGSYQAQRADQNTSISFVVWAESRVYDMSPDDAKDLVDLWNGAGPDLSGLFDRLKQFANFDTMVLDFE
jgi:hypothetical protein